jgi:hypothetical protein
MSFWKKDSSNDNNNTKGSRRDQKRTSQRQKTTGETPRDQEKGASGRENSNKVAKYVADKEAGRKATPQEREKLHREISKKGLSNEKLKKS